MSANGRSGRADAQTDASGPRLLAYTIAFDRPGSTVYRAMAKLLLSSLLRTGFGGDIIVFHNGEAPMFLTGRADVSEIYADPLDIDRSLSEAGCRFKYAAAAHIDASRYDHILYLDCDCLALDNVDELIADTDYSLGYVPEPGMNLAHDGFQGHFDDAELRTLGDREGSNAGVWYCRATDYPAMCAEVLRLYGVAPVKPPRFWGDQAQWNRMLVDGRFPARKLTERDVAMPTLYQVDFRVWGKAKLLHFAGEGERLPLMFGVFCYPFYGGAAPLLIDFLES